MLRVLYLTHDVNDPTTLKRVRMLRAGGAGVIVMGFHRESSIAAIEHCPVIDLGRTYPAQFIQRAWATLHEVMRIKKYRAMFLDADVIIARNLEMLAIAVRGSSLVPTPPALVYECLDIHRLLLRQDMLGRFMRGLEAWLSRRAKLLITSSPGFVRHYFNWRSSVMLPVLLLENKVLRLSGDVAARPTGMIGKPWRIGWFGVLRCRKSFDALCAFVTAHPGLVEVVLRGKPALDQIPDFYARVSTTPGMQFSGAFAAEELPAIYGDVHFAWAIDFFEEGQNSLWLLPNRLYDSGYHGCVPLAIAGVETARFLETRQIGQVLSDIAPDTLAAFFSTLEETQYRSMRDAVLATPRDMWRFAPTDCQNLIEKLTTLLPVPRRSPVMPSSKPLLVVIPCLNEARHLPGLLDYLIAESESLPMTIVVADGGSTDGSIDIVARRADTCDFLHYLPNPARIHSAGVNLAVKQFGDEADYLVRIDAHAHYPPGYITTLLSEAIATSADSVTVSMHTVATQGFQTAIAAAQNSRLGNGGSAHRRADTGGRWVDHGHHALMRVAAFRDIGGYDERFTHNEDAELDMRLRRAGYRIWLTSRTVVDYTPRATVGSLFRQYRNYGRGRARTLLKHHQLPKLRQALPLMVVPVLLLAPLFAVPAAVWVSACLAYGGWLALGMRRREILLSGPAAMVMHAGWSLGFWQTLLSRTRRAA